MPEVPFAGGGRLLTEQERAAREANRPSLGLQRALGPHLMQGLRNAGNLLNFLGPQADIQEMVLSSQAAMDNLRRRELGLGGLNLAYTAAAPLGLFFPGTVGRPKGQAKPISSMQEFNDGVQSGVIRSDPDASGACYACAADDLRARGDAGQLEVGTVVQKDTGKRIYHAWTTDETGGLIREPETGEWFTRETFTEAFDAAPMVTTTRPEATIALLRAGKRHWGPDLPGALGLPDKPPQVVRPTRNPVSNPFRSRPPVKPLEMQMNQITGPQFSNGDIGLVGARPPSAGLNVSEPGTQVMELSVFDMKKKGGPVDVGVVTMNVTRSPSGELTPKIQGLINIEINKDLRGQGLGKRVVDALAASSPDGLRLYDIQEKARGYWERLGAIDFKKRPGGPYLDAALPPPPKP
jgi:hypothetical protein